MNLAEILRTHALNQGNKLAVVSDDQSLDYSALWRMITDLASQLQAAGIEAGERVGLSMPDHPVHLAAHYAVAFLGAVIVPIDHRWTAAEKVAAARAFKLKLVASDIDIAGLPPTTQAIKLKGHGATAKHPPELVQDPGDLLISLSSGSTGKPKGALLTHRQFYERFVSQWVTIGYGSNDCFAIVTPLYFGAGRSFAMSLLTAGGTVRLAKPGLKPEPLLAVLREPDVSATFLPPTLLRRWLPADNREPLLPQMRYLLVSGEPLHAEEAQQVATKICPNLVGYYASSEGGGISVLPADGFANYAHTVGLPTFRTAVEIVDRDDKLVSNGEIGRLRYRGPGVATTMVDSNGVEKTENTEGWFYPGDLAERLPSGHIVLRGRDKDVIIRAGVNVYPGEVETVIAQHPDVNEIAVVGHADDQRGELVIAYFVGTAQGTELQAWCEGALAPYKIPTQFVPLAELPKSNSGKIDKRALAARKLV